jgi:NTE family protein
MNNHRALVLGGGGSTGNAWLIGVVAGLRARNLDVTTADLIVGTSAGATAAAQITSADPEQLYRETLDAQYASRGGSASGLMDMTAAVIAASSDLADMRRRMGAAFLGLDDRSDAWRRTVIARLPSQEWHPAVRITAVDARSGEPVVFDSSSGVGLADAVAASTAGGFAYRIGDGRYIDGGYRTNADNADVAAGYERVLVLSPFGGRTRLPLEWGTDLAAQVAELRAAGTRVETVFPGNQELHGANSMDLTLRPAAARAGFALGQSLELADFWAGT